MNFKALITNITYSFRCTSTTLDAIKRLIWIYRIPERLGFFKIDYLINFKFPIPLGNIPLKVRHNNGSDNFIISEVFDNLCYELLLKNPPNYILDLGANAGFTAIYYAKQYPHATIACVEPMKDNINLLRANVELNNFKIKIFEAAISTANGVIKMELSDMDYGHKVSEINFGKTLTNSQFIEVKAITLPTILEEMKWPRIDILKIDIEGYEGVLFSSNCEWLRYIGTIIMEIHEGVSVENIYEITLKYGFDTILRKHGNLIISKKELLD